MPRIEMSEEVAAFAAQTERMRFKRNTYLLRVVVLIGVPMVMLFTGLVWSSILFAGRQAQFKACLEYAYALDAAEHVPSWAHTHMINRTLSSCWKYVS